MPYQTADIKWGDPVYGQPSGTVTWSADYVSELGIAAGFNSTDINAALSAAFDRWESVAAIDFQYVATGGDVTVIAGSLGAAAGTAYYTFGSNPGLSEIFSGEITFNSDLTWSPYGGSGGVDFHAVALHEIGHIIGLDHVNDVSEIMNPVIYGDDLGDGDIAGARFIYGTDSGDTPSAPNSPGLSTGGGSGSSGGGAIGLVVGLLALIVSLLGGGAGAAVAIAAGHAPDGTGDDLADADMGHEGDPDHQCPDFLPMIPVSEDDLIAWNAADDEDGIFAV